MKRAKQVKVVKMVKAKIRPSEEIHSSMAVVIYGEI